LKRIAIAAAVVALAAFAVNGTIAQSQELPGTKPTKVTTASNQRVVKFRPPPLKLPNVRQLTRQLLSAERSLVQRQLVSSRNVIAFFENSKRSWLRAPRHAKCWEVPWQRSCTIARASYKLHLTLAVAAERKLNRELPLPNDWATAVRVIQRVFPGTESWLMSCSGAEGGHGRFVIYGGGSYYPGAEHAQTFHGDMVGGPMQYMWGTFRGHYRHGLDSLRSRGFQVDLPSPDDVRAWLHPLAQAIAAGWARWSGNDDSHWSASWGDGC